VGKIVQTALLKGRLGMLQLTKGQVGSKMTKARVIPIQLRQFQTLKPVQELNNREVVI
jgi:hypothetical protein